MVIDKVRDKLGSLCIICSLGQVKKNHRTITLWPFNCPWTSIKFGYFYIPVFDLCCNVPSVHL